MNKSSYRWAAAGDLNAFFGLMLDNIADLLLTIGLLAAVFGFPTKFAIGHMVPGTAIGVFVGDLIFFWMAIRLARKTGRDDVTSMPLGLDTPSTFGMVFFVLGPSYLVGLNGLGLSPEEAAVRTWHIGIWSIVMSGLFKSIFAFTSNWIRDVIPRAGLLGSLAAVALVLISFLPFIEALHFPVVGMTALAIILVTLVARIQLPWKLPGALVALIVSGAIYYLMLGLGLLGATPEPVGIEASEALLPTDWLGVFRLEWMTWTRFQEAAVYLPIVIPFALGTVIGGIDCTESAAAAGDEYNTNSIIGAEALATLVAGLCGGVIQTTPYIGHPAYKAMGGRAAYTLATALFVGGAGVLGYFGFMYSVIPKPTLFPILVFIGLEITSQSFQATPKRHYPAVSFACVPALAALVLVFVGDLQGTYKGLSFELQGEIATLVEQGHVDQQGAESLEALSAKLNDYSSGNIVAPTEEGHLHPAPISVKLQTLQMLSSGFILTSLMWATILAYIIDRKLVTAGVFTLACSLFSLFGLIHSPFPSGELVLGWNVPNLPAAAAGQGPVYMAVTYLFFAAVMFVIAFCKLAPQDEPELETQQETAA